MTTTDARPTQRVTVDLADLDAMLRQLADPAWSYTGPGVKPLMEVFGKLGGMRSARAESVNVADLLDVQRILLTLARDGGPHAAVFESVAALAGVMVGSGLVR